MEAFGRGWNFLKQAWQMAFKDKDLLKPTLFALVVGGIVSVIGIIPIIGAALLLPDSSIGNLIMIVLGAILVFVQFIVSYVFSGMTVYLIYQFLTEGDGKMSDAWAVVRRDFLDLLTLAAASTVVNMLKNAANRNRRGGVGAAVARAGTGLLETLWTEAALLVLPAMVIDDLNLKKGLERVWNITKNNLLLVGISTVGVKWVTGLIGFVLAVIGAAIGFAIGGGLAYIAGDATVTAIGIGIGVMIFFFFIMIASVISSYTTTAYHTCLYIWARDVETAKEQGKATERIAAPAPLAAVLG
jgi:membrane-anchored glycerophosphoryl diester phosphodiesterase (GDPDase)